MPSVYITRKIPDAGPLLLREKGYEVEVSPHDRVLSKSELISVLHRKQYDAVLCLLTDVIDAEVFDAAPTAKIFANYAVGFNNIDITAAKERGITIANTPGVLTNTVAEHTFALIMALAHRVVEADHFTRAGKYMGWAPELLLGSDLAGMTLGVLGLGRIGSRVAHHGSRGFDMRVIYYDLARNEQFEKEYGAEYRFTPEDLLKEADIVSVHVPLLDSTRHLINAQSLALMKPTAYLVNTSRGPVVDEAALVEALKRRIIQGAALDVFENEPALAQGLTELENVIVTPHIASATVRTRAAMSRLAAENIIAFFDGRTPPNVVK